MLKDDINVPLLLTIGAVSSILLLVLLIGVQAWFLWEYHYYSDAKWQGITNREVYELKKRQAESLNVIARADADKGTYRIPIEQAMRVIAENGGRKPTP
ncbi:MAG: hypothetical protein ACK4PI_08480 [Tepidisphaerales bacterium]